MLLEDEGRCRAKGGHDQGVIIQGKLIIPHARRAGALSRCICCQ
jgi:hypothetical protein